MQQRHGATIIFGYFIDRLRKTHYHFLCSVCLHSLKHLPANKSIGLSASIIHATHYFNYVKMCEWLPFCWCFPFLHGVREGEPERAHERARESKREPEREKEISNHLSFHVDQMHWNFPLKMLCLLCVNIGRALFGATTCAFISALQCKTICVHKDTPHTVFVFCVLFFVLFLSASPFSFSE